MTLLARLALLLSLTLPLRAEPIPDCGIGPWGLCRYLQPSGQPLTQARFQQATRFAGGLAAVQIRGLWGYVGRQGQRVIPPRYLQAAPFRHGLAEVVTVKGTGLITLTGDAVPLPPVRRAIPVSATTVMTFADDASDPHAASITPELWRDPEEEVPYGFTTARLYNLSTGWLDTPPLRRMVLIPGATNTFWFQIATPGPTWDLYDWGLMRDDGAWVIPPGLQDIFVLPSGLTLTFDPPRGQRSAPDGYLGYGLQRNLAGHEAVVDAEGHVVSGSITDTGVTGDDRPLVQQAGAWFVIDPQGGLTPYAGPRTTLWPRVTVQHDPALTPYQAGPDCPGGLTIFSQPDPLTTAADVQAARWGIRDGQGQVLIAPVHRAITCPQQGVALVPDIQRRMWCPVSPLPQVDNPANCQRIVWDGILSDVVSEPLDPDPFQAQILSWQNKLLPKALQHQPQAKPVKAAPAIAPPLQPPRHSLRPKPRPVL